MTKQRMTTAQKATTILAWFRTVNRFTAEGSNNATARLSRKTHAQLDQILSDQESLDKLLRSLVAPIRPDASGRGE